VHDLHDAVDAEIVHRLEGGRAAAVVDAQSP
jgi:hypothetical protein